MVSLLDKLGSHQIALSAAFACHFPRRCRPLPLHRRPPLAPPLRRRARARRSPPRAVATYPPCARSFRSFPPLSGPSRSTPISSSSSEPGTQRTLSRCSTNCRSRSVIMRLSLCWSPRFLPGASPRTQSVRPRRLQTRSSRMTISALLVSGYANMLVSSTMR